MNTLKALAEKIMIGISVTMLILGLFWVEGLYYVGPVLTIASAIALGIRFLPFLQELWSRVVGWFGGVKANADEKAKAKEAEKAKKAEEAKKADEAPEKVEEPKAEAKVATLEEKKSLYQKCVQLADDALVTGDFGKAATLMDRADTLKKEIDVEEAEEARKEAEAKAAEAELRERIAKAKGGTTSTKKTGSSKKA